MKTFAIGIPTINRYDLLKESLLKYLNQDFVGIQIFIVDNGHQGIKEDLKHPNLFVYEPDKNLGVAGSWNLLSEAIFEEHDYALIINDDVYLGATSDKIQDLLEKERHDFYVAQMSWCAFILPETTYELVGGFDEKFFPAYFEDNDFHYRMKLLDMTYYVSDIITPIVFRNSMTIDKDPSLNKTFDQNKEYYIQKWGGEPGEEKWNHPYDKRKLHIITPTSRIQNLDLIYKSISQCKNYESDIDVTWWIVLDQILYKEYKDIQHKYEKLDNNLTVNVVLSNKENAIAGHAHRNIILNLLSILKNKDQWVYFLDDDNLLHEKFYEFFANRKLIEHYDGIIFSQIHPNGQMRLTAEEDKIKVCHVDTAMFLFNLAILDDLRFVETDYCADGIFIEELYKRHKKRFRVIPDILAYYNAVHKSDNQVVKTIVDKQIEDNFLDNCPVPILQNAWEFKKLLSLYNELEPQAIMEIGSFYGGTLWYWLISYNVKKCITLDYPVPPSDGRYEEMIECRKKWDSWKSQYMVEEFHNVIGDSTSERSKEEINNILQERELDFLFIDGGHTYNVVKSDYETYSKYVRKGGLIAFHDVVGLEEVKKYWNEVKVGKPYIEICENISNGWGIGVLTVE